MRCLNGVLSVSLQNFLDRSSQRACQGCVVSVAKGCLAGTWISTKGAYHLGESTLSQLDSLSNIGATRHAHSVTPSASPSYSRPCGAFPQARPECSCLCSCRLASNGPE